MKIRTLVLAAALLAVAACSASPTGPSEGPSVPIPADASRDDQPVPPRP